MMNKGSIYIYALRTENLYLYSNNIFLFFCFSAYSPFITSGGSRIFQMGGRCFVANGGVHILFSGKKCMKSKEIGLKWGGAHLLAPCHTKITIFL